MMEDLGSPSTTGEAEFQKKTRSMVRKEK